MESLSWHLQTYHSRKTQESFLYLALDRFDSYQNAALGYITEFHTLGEHIHLFYDCCSRVTALKRTVLLKKLLIMLETGSPPCTDTPFTESCQGISVGYQPSKNTNCSACNGSTSQRMAGIVKGKIHLCSISQKGCQMRSETLDLPPDYLWGHLSTSPHRTGTVELLKSIGTVPDTQQCLQIFAQRDAAALTQSVFRESMFNAEQEDVSTKTFVRSSRWPQRTPTRKAQSPAKINNPKPAPSR